MKKTFLALAFGLLAAITLLRLLDPAPVAALREAYFDHLQRFMPRPAEPTFVRVVDIDEASLAALGQWPWPRDRLADLVGRLADLGAAVVTFDVLFAEPDRLSPSNLSALPSVQAAVGSQQALNDLAAIDNDAIFADAMRQMPVALGVAHATAASSVPPEALAGYAEIGGNARDGFLQLPSVTPIAPALREAASGIGSINVAGVSDDGLIRSVPLVWRTDTGIMPGLAIEALRVAMGEETLLIYAGPLGAEALSVGGIEVPMSVDGSLRVRFRHNAPDLYVSAADLFDPEKSEALRSRIEGHIIFVGTSAAGLLDTRTTALGEPVPGVSIHAQIVEQILLGRYLVRDDVTAALEILALILLGIVVTFRMAISGPLASVILGASAAVITLAVSLYVFVEKSILFDVTFPLIGGFAAFSALSMFQYAVSDRQRRLIRQSFSRYVAPGVLQELEKRGKELVLGGEMRDVTVLFADVRNFTGLSETMPATDLVSLLNEIFTDLSQQILATRGTIDKFIGDEIMAFWNAPLEVAQHPRAACLSVLGMRGSLVELNRQRAAKGSSPIALAIGLASGSACVGNMGSRDRFNYTVLGDTVNQAARIEDACRTLHCDALVSSEVAAAASDLALLPGGSLSLKGVSRKVDVWLLAGGVDYAKSAEFAALRTAHETAMSVIRKGGDAKAELTILSGLAAATAPHLLDHFQSMPSRSADYQPD